MLTLNPRGLLPILVHEDTVITESAAIIGYLDRLYPSEPSLFGATAEDQALVWSKVLDFNSNVLPFIGRQLIRPMFTGATKGRETKIKVAAERVHQELLSLDEQMASQTWIVDRIGHISAADILIFPFIACLERIGEKEEAQVLGLTCTNIKQQYSYIYKWYTLLKGLDAYNASYPPHW